MSLSRLWSLVRPRLTVRASGLTTDTSHVGAHVLEARRRHERWISGAVCLVVLGVMPSIWWRVTELEGEGGQRVLAMVGMTGLWYLVSFLRTKSRIPTLFGHLVNTHIELLVPTAVIFTDASTSVELALLNATPQAYAVAVAVSILRLRPWLSLYAGLLAAALQLTVYYVIMAGAEPSLDVLEPPFFWSRAVLLLMVGLTGFMVSTTLRRLQVGVVTEALERERVRSAFGSYVAEQVVERILSGDLAPTTERRALSVVFVDIRGFTTYAEARDPEEVVEVLSGALEAFSHAVEEQEGIVNKFLGDGLMALFGAPMEQDDHALRAVRCAGAMAQAASRLRRDGLLADLKIGIGIHTGEVVVGDIGSRSRREYTAIGDVVNVASRIENATKSVPTTLLVSDSTLSALPEGSLETRQLEPLALRGREGTMVIHEVLVIEGESVMGAAS